MALRWFLTEPNVYQSLKEQASGCFAEFLGAGDLICSLVLPAGYALLIEKIPGVTCSDEMLENPKLRTLLETRLRSAILAVGNAGFVLAIRSRAMLLLAQPVRGSFCSISSTPFRMSKELAPKITRNSRKSWHLRSECSAPKSFRCDR